MTVATGLDRATASDFAQLHGKRVGVLCNQASVDSHFRHIVDLLLPFHRAGTFTISAVFGPQHGLFGHTQDNMIEWEGTIDSRTGLRVVSLYGRHREPTAEMLREIDLFVVDILDIGSRYYTFQWTMTNSMAACARLGIPVLVLDRPNPIGGERVEGPLLESGFESFVGGYPVPIRHGLTPGEMAQFVKGRFIPDCQLEVVHVENWDRTLYADETGYAWAIPSPNMPTVETAVVYPGGCLLEGTNLSEGRGTTRPFEMLGAPFVDGWKLADALNRLKLGGVAFRPIQFEPTFNKHSGCVCEGVFVHVTDRWEFAPVFTYVAILREIIRQTGIHCLPRNDIADKFVAESPECELPGFAWKLPPYEYVYDRMPIDILAGNDWLRFMIESDCPLTEIRERMHVGVVRFMILRI